MAGRSISLLAWASVQPASAIVAARGCERFARLVHRLDAPLAKLYRSLIKLEGGHDENYLELAHRVSVDRDVQSRIAFFAAREAEPISEPDSDFRFHSGVPIQGRRAISGART